MKETATNILLNLNKEKRRLNEVDTRLAEIKKKIKKMAEGKK